MNINAGRNNDMMRKCRRLSDYADFIAQIRWKMDEGWSLDEATEISIRRCIDRGILADILTKYGTEVYRMILTEYDEKEEREYLRQEGRKAGLEEGRAEGRSMGRTEILTEILLERLGEMYSIPQEVKQRIATASDEETLRRWYTMAGSVKSLEEFIKKM